MMESERKVLIVGGGIGGLALAAFLGSVDNLSCEVWEGRSDQGRAGGLQLAANGVRVLSKLGLMESLSQQGAATTGMRFQNSTGQIIVDTNHQTKEKYEFAPLNLPRSDVREALAAKCRSLPNVTIHEGIRCVAVEHESAEKVTIRLDNGQLVDGDLLVGADGVSSAIRSYLLPDGPKPEYTGLVSFGGFVSQAGIEKHIDQERLDMVFGPSGFFGYGPFNRLNDDYTVGWWSTQPYNGSLDELRGLTTVPLLADRQEQVLAWLKEAHAGWAEPLPSILDRATTSLCLPIYDIAFLPNWGRNRIVLLAHAITPHSGQGASLALEDAECLAYLLRAKADWTNIAGLLESIRKERAQSIVLEGRRSAPMKGRLSWLAQKFREWFLWLFMNRFLADLSVLYNYDASEAARKFLEAAQPQQQENTQ